MSDYIEHIPVLVDEVSELLVWKGHGTYVDATAGAGGHVARMLDAHPHVRFIALDVDPEAIAYLEQKFKGTDRVKVIHGNYRDLPHILRSVGLSEVSGVLLDLGVSTHQVLAEDRGFSFRKPGLLDMRFDPSKGVSAYDLVNKLGEEELADLIYRYGEEHKARRIAKAIVESRSKGPIRTTTELAEVILTALGRRHGRIHPATRTFQALRIATNSELDNLQQLLESLLDVLEPGGRAAVISYHSLEDRIVKHFFKEWEKSGKGIQVTKKPVVPTDEEIQVNPRARSAKLRVFMKGG
ncbi:16S rRNA (cytosine(1402)-N(4))-methyltransferase RsmH [Coprothermobacteraceae bacterium]|nr:16S rRNA (cytosine(1402)-N(4))-methyltransferase RsmH [Coprothermobacteraceae bacterium]